MQAINPRNLPSLSTMPQPTPEYICGKANHRPTTIFESEYLANTPQYLINLNCNFSSIINLILPLYHLNKANKTAVYKEMQMLPVKKCYRLFMPFQLFQQPYYASICCCNCWMRSLLLSLSEITYLLAVFDTT